MSGSNIRRACTRSIGSSARPCLESPSARLCERDRVVNGASAQRSKSGERHFYMLRLPVAPLTQIPPLRFAALGTPTSLHGGELEQAAHPASIPPESALALVREHECVDVSAGELPIIVEVGDHLFHERLGKADRPLRVAQIVDQDGERELLRAVALVGPFEAVAGEALDLLMLVQLVPIDCHDQAVDGPLALIGLHGLTSTLSPA